jgi:hypothetical protein
MGGSSNSTSAVTGYLKFLLFVYIVTSPFLLEKSGVTADEGKRAVASAGACLLGALGLGLVVYDRGRDASGRALGALLILAWLSTVIVIWRSAPPARSAAARWAGIPAASTLSQKSLVVEGLAVSEDDGDYPASAPEPPHDAPWPPPSPVATAPPPPAPPPEWAVEDPGDGLSPDGLGRIFEAPTMKEFMVPSPDGFVTPTDLDDIQSGTVLHSDSAVEALVPLGTGSYSAQGVIFGSDLCGTN